MSAVQFAGWVIFAVIAFLIGQNVQPYFEAIQLAQRTGEEVSGFHLTIAGVVTFGALFGALSVFYALYQRFRTLGYPGWLSLAPILVFVVPIAVSLVTVIGFGLVDYGTDSTMNSGERAGAITLGGGAIVLAVFVLFGLFGKPRSD